MLLYYPTKNMREVLQPIDSVYGRSLRYNIGHGLDIWFISDEKLSKWEGKLTAVERRIW